jgi:hypothetical protein
LLPGLIALALDGHILCAKPQVGFSRSCSGDGPSQGITASPDMDQCFLAQGERALRQDSLYRLVAKSVLRREQGNDLVLLAS